MTLPEIMVALMVLSVAVYILSTTVAASVQNARLKSQRTLAADATMNQIELIRALPQEDVFALYNSTATDDPYGAGTGPGPRFDVAGLDPVPGEESVGQVLVPGRGAILDESLDQPDFGLPRDLDGNMAIEDGDRSDTYIVLPVIVRVRWNSRRGPREFEMHTMLADLAKWEP